MPLVVFFSAMPSPDIPLVSRPWNQQKHLNNEEFQVCTRGKAITVSTALGSGFNYVFLTFEKSSRNDTTGMGSSAKSTAVETMSGTA